MSKTVDELRQLYDDAYQAVIVAEDDKLASEEWDDMLYRTNIFAGAERAGIAAVIGALRDAVVKSNDMDFDYSVARYLDEILGDAGEKVAGGSSSNASGPVCGHTAPATDPAPAVCEWTYKGEARPMPSETCARYNAREVFATEKWICTCCWKPIKFTEAKT